MDETTLNFFQVGARLRVEPFREDTPYIEQLMRMGVVPGTELTIVRAAPLGDPVEIRLRGYSLVLRRHEAAAINVAIIE